MKFDPSFELRNVCGENILIATGLKNINFSNLINLNETAVDIYKAFNGRDFELSEIADFIEEHYDGASREQIEDDLHKLFEQLLADGVVLA